MCRSFFQVADGLANFTLYRVAFSFTADKGNVLNVSNWSSGSSNVLTIEKGKVDIPLIYLSISKFCKTL